MNKNQNGKATVEAKKLLHLRVTQLKINLNSFAVVCKSRSWDFISNVRSIKGARRQHVISDQNFSKDQHLSMDLNECRNFPHCSNSNFKFSKHTHLLSGDNPNRLKEFFCSEGEKKEIVKQMMTNFQHFMGPLNKWGFVQAIAHTQGNLLPPKYS